MPLFHMANLRHALPRVQWRHGLRAGVAVGASMAVCTLLHIPLGWAALGALYVSLVDSGGPLRTRLESMAAVLLPGAVAVLLGAISGGIGREGIGLGLAVTFVLCFGMTIARVFSQAIASTSVLILICYVVAYGGPVHTLAAGIAAALFYLAGGIWSASLAYFLWPLDAFLPARRAVADLYASLADLAHALVCLQDSDGPARFNAAVARTRRRIEEAQATLAATPARMAARTIRARNLSVLAGTADLILARLLHVAEVAADAPAARAALARWLLAAVTPIELALRERPINVAQVFAPEGSRWLDLHRTQSRVLAAFAGDPDLAITTRTAVAAALDDTLFNLEISFEAIRALWTGSDSRKPNPQTADSNSAGQIRAPARSFQATAHAWSDLLRANLTPRSLMFRYALRLAAVVTADQLLLRLIHFGHSYWLPMTSLIVLRPFAGQTVQRSADRVLGTVLGGLLAALLTTVLPSAAAQLPLVVLCSAACVALYAVDYGWYCFFVTPAIVLLTRPPLHDWHLAALRAGFTCLGAAVAVLAMLLLWPERESLLLPRQLGRGAAADAAYLRALLLFWSRSAGSPRSQRIATEREVLAPARRQCGLTANDAEETLDHALLEHRIPLNPRRSHTGRLNAAALTFTTYLRRLTRTTTALAGFGLDLDSPDAAPDTALTQAAVAAFAIRLDSIAARLLDETPTSTPAPAIAPLPPVPTNPLLADHLRRLDRQVSILEQTAGELAAL